MSGLLGTDPVQVGQSGSTTLAYLQWGQLDPTVVPTAGTPGSLFLRIPVVGMPPTAIGLYMKTVTDDADTNWVLISSGGGGGGTFEREDFELDAADISNGFIDLGFLANHNSVIANLDGAALLLEGLNRDYTLSDGVTTRLTFDPTLIPFLAEGELIQVQYTH
jgi:hypothetical protein